MDTDVQQSPQSPVNVDFTYFLGVFGPISKDNNMLNLTKNRKTNPATSVSEGAVRLYDKSVNYSHNPVTPPRLEVSSVNSNSTSNVPLVSPIKSIVHNLERTMACDKYYKSENVEVKLLRPEHTVEKTKIDVENIENPKKGFADRLKYLRSVLTVEPIMVGLVIPTAIAKLAIQNLNLAKACLVKLNYGTDVCEPLINRNGNNLTEYEREVQKVISSIETWKSIIHTALPTLVVMFMGAWSDRTGNRKICMLLPIFGDLLMTASNIASSIFFYEIPVEVTMFLEALLPAITGGWLTFFIGIFSYISDITTPESRTYRIGLVNLCLTVGILIGTSLSGILLKSWGYVGTFLLSGFIYLLTMVYGYLYLKNNTKPANTKSRKVKLSELLSLQKDTVSVFTKKRNGDLRLMIILNLLVVAIIYGPSHAEHIITYLFVRYRLGWDAVKFSIYSTYNHLTHALAAFLSITILSKRWGVDDSVLCLISVTSKLVGSIYINFVGTDFQMYLVPIVQFLNATTFTSLRSMSSKLVPSDELGKMNSLFSLVETLAALVFDPVYATIYSHTMKQYTSAVFLFSAVMTLPAISILIWFVKRHRQELRQRVLELGNLPDESSLPT